MQLTVPKHYEIRDRIAELIAGSAVGTPVPTERELAERLHTSRTTVRQALAALELDGKIKRIQAEARSSPNPNVSWYASSRPTPRTCRPKA